MKAELLILCGPDSREGQRLHALSAECWAKEAAQNWWGTGNSRTDAPTIHRQTPGVIARGADEFSSRDQRHNKAAQSERPAGPELAGMARHLGNSETNRWRNDERHGIYRCNQFVDAALRESGIHLRWDAAHIPTVHHMRQQLALDRDFQLVFKAQLVKFDQYRPQAGDVVFWDMIPPHYPSERPGRFEHSGILDDKRVLMYAGSTRSRGYDETPLATLMKLYGEPAVIYRYSPQRR